MSLGERQSRHERLLRVICENDLASWGERFLAALTEPAEVRLEDEKLGLAPELETWEHV
jgi:trehalose-6-phosphate synthase